MPQEEVKVSFYKVTQCGYYSHGANAPAFGGLQEVLTELAAWSNGAALALTKLFDPLGDDLPVYLFGMRQVGNDWTFTTWNEIPAHDGKVASVSRRAVVGQAQVHLNAVDADDIPGYATYFWAVPDQNLIASIRFNHAVSGQQGMRSYIERFMALESSHAVQEQNDGGEARIVGYVENADAPMTKVAPRFRTGAYVKPGQVRYILNNHARVKKVVRRAHLHIVNPAEQTLLQGFVQFLRGGNGNNHAAVDRSAYVELEYTPTQDELRAMIEAETADLDASAWDDMGFIMHGETSKTYWLGRASASDRLQLDVERDADTGAIVTLESLSAALAANRAAILRILQDNA